MFGLLRDVWDERRSQSVEPDPIRPVISARVTDHLIPGERVLISTRRHALVAVWMMPTSLVVLVVVGYLTGKLPPGSPFIDVLWWLWFATVAYTGWRLLEWSNEIFVVTDRRVMLFTGFLTQRIAMMPVVKVTDLTYRRTVPGRLLRYGDFVVESAGQDQALHLVRFLPNPRELYQELAGTLFNVKKVASPPSPDRDLRMERPARSGDFSDTGELDRVED